MNAIKMLVCILILSQTTVKSQNSILKLWAYDSVGNSDTIRFGLQDDSTLDMDLELGEQDIYGTSNESLDLRIIQRDSNTYNCLSLGSDPYFQQVHFNQNIDSKTDFRPYLGIDGIQNNSFEILIHAENYPVYIELDASQIGFMEYQALNVFRTADCITNVVVGTTAASDQYSNMGISNLDEETKYILFIFESFDESGYIVNVEESHDEEHYPKVFPNPFSENLIINQEGKTLYDESEIYNIMGELVYKSALNTDPNKLGPFDFSPGVYFLHLINGSDRKTLKIIKHE